MRRRLRLSNAAPLTALLFPVLLTAHAAAEDDDASKKIATDLFDKGVKLMSSKKCDEVTPSDADRPACKEALDLFLKAQRTYPKALGPYRNAAFVAKSLGLVALASRNFRHVARNAPLEQSEARRKWAGPAQKEAEALEARIPYVTMSVKNATAEEVSIKLDGEAFASHLVGTAVAIDPGDHDVVAETKDGRKTSLKLSVAEKDKKDAVLQFEPKKVAPPPPASASVAATSTGTTGDAPPPDRRLAPKIVVGAGGVLVGAGLVFGLMAKSAKDACSGGVCDSQADVDKAKSRANVSTILVGVGVAAVAGGALWWSLGKPSKETQASIGVTPGLSAGAVALRITR